MEKNKAIVALFNVQKKLYSEGVFFKKQGNNPHFKKSYLQLPDLLTTVVPMLLDENCVLIQGTRHSENPDIAIVVTKVVHPETGDEVLNEIDMPVAKLNPQDMGKAVTYGRRYGLEPLFGIPTKDDDGEGAMKREEKVVPPKPKPLDIFAELTKATGQNIGDIKGILKEHGIENLTQIKALGIKACITIIKGEENE